MLHFPLVLMDRLNKTESAVFYHRRFSLFLKEPFFKIILKMLTIYKCHKNQIWELLKLSEYSVIGGIL